MSLLYKVINPPVKALLRSPLHGLMSKNTLLLEFTGRKSGKALSTPISYHLSNNAAHCFTNRNFAWWRNLLNGQTVSLRIQGHTHQSKPQVETDNLDLMSEGLEAFLRAVPRDAAHAGVKLDTHGNPNTADIQRIIADMVYLKFPIEDTHNE